MSQTEGSRRPDWLLRLQGALTVIAILVGFSFFVPFLPFVAAYTLGEGRHSFDAGWVSGSITVSREGSGHAE